MSADDPPAPPSVGSPTSPLPATPPSTPAGGSKKTFAVPSVAVGEDSLLEAISLSSNQSTPTAASSASEAGDQVAALIEQVNAQLALEGMCGGEEAQSPIAEKSSAGPSSGSRLRANTLTSINDLISSLRVDVLAPALANVSTGLDSLRSSGASFSSSSLASASAAGSAWTDAASLAAAGASSAAASAASAQWDSALTKAADLRKGAVLQAAALTLNVGEGVLALKAKSRETVEALKSQGVAKAADTTQLVVTAAQLAVDYLTSLALHLQSSQIVPIITSLGNLRSTFASNLFAGAAGISIGSLPPPSSSVASSDAYQTFKCQSLVHEVSVSAREEWRQVFVVSPRRLLFYEFVVKDLDVAMAVFLRTQGDGGAVEETLVPERRYKSGAIHKGSIEAGESEKVFVFVINNKYSLMRPKTVLYRLSVVNPMGGDDDASPSPLALSLPSAVSCSLSGPSSPDASSSHGGSLLLALYAARLPPPPSFGVRGLEWLYELRGGAAAAAAAAVGLPFP